MTSEASATSTPQRRFGIRHPKQRFENEAEFVWRKRVRLEGGFTSPGDPVEKSIFTAAKLLNLWRSNLIERADWVDPSAHKIPTEAPVEVSLFVVGRGCYRLVLTDADGDEPIEHEYKARGLGNLLERATSLGVRERVLSLVAAMKDEEPTTKAAEPGPAQEGSQEPEGEDEDAAGDDPADSDPPATVDLGGGLSGASDGGGVAEGSGVPAGSPPDAEPWEEG